MAYSEILANRVREALAQSPRVVEKKMFGGIAFMVNGKMCVTVGKDRIMCRIDPAIHDKVVKRKGCRTVLMKGREYKGYVYISEEALKTKKDFDDWIALALEFNKVAKKSAKKRNSIRRS